MEDIEFQQILMLSIRDGIREGVKSKLTGYNSPLDKIIESAFLTQKEGIRDLLEEGISKCLSSEAFRHDIQQAVNQNLAKVLVQRFGGEVEKQVNALKSDPTTRARITLAIEQIVKDANK